MTILAAEKVEMPFGYYTGRTLGELGVEDPLYLSHMAHQEIRDSFLVEAIATVVDKHAETIAAKIRAGEKPKLFNGSSAAVTHAPRPKQTYLF